MVISRLPFSRQLAIKSESGQLDLDAICSRFFFFLSSLIFVSAVFLFFPPPPPTVSLPACLKRNQTLNTGLKALGRKVKTLRKTLVKTSWSIGRETKGYLHAVVFQLKDPELYKTWRPTMGPAECHSHCSTTAGQGCRTNCQNLESCKSQLSIPENERPLKKLKWKRRNVKTLGVRFRQ